MTANCDYPDCEAKATEPLTIKLEGVIRPVHLEFCKEHEEIYLETPKDFDRFHDELLILA